MFYTVQRDTYGQNRRSKEQLRVADEAGARRHKAFLLLLYKQFLFKFDYDVVLKADLNEKTCI